MLDISKDPCENCGSDKAEFLDTIVDTPECGCNLIVCTQCGNDIAVRDNA